MNNTWDYLVIGAGHNGLAAACTLAKAGQSVLVIEQRAIIGGLSASHAYLPEAPQHLLSIGAMDDALMAPSSMAREFHLHQHGYHPIPLQHPYGWMNDEGETLLLFSDFERTVKEIHYFSPKDASTYRSLRGTFDFLMDSLDKIGAKHPAAIGKLDVAGSLLKLAGDRQIRETLKRMAACSAFEMIDDTFESDAMRGLWAFWTCMFAPATAPGGGIYLSGFANVHRSGIFRPRGGMTGLVGAFANCLKSLGGEIRLNSPVQRILIDSQYGTASGVRLADGTQLQARHGVLANCAPQVALGELLGDGDLDPGIVRQLRHIPANSAEVAPFKIDLASSGRLSYRRAQQLRKQRDGADLRKTTFMTGSLEDHIAQHKACLRGEAVTFEPPLYFSILSGADPSVAPDNGDVLYLYANVPVEPIGGWADNKDRYGQQIYAAASRYIDGLESEIGRLQTCPADFIEQFSAPRATYFHVDMLPTRMGNNRPAPGLGGYQTPVPQLYLAGSGSHPSGGVSGQPGKLGAEFALSQQRNSVNV
jgi:phytoene dehydrogenase-like protein